MASHSVVLQVPKELFGRDLSRPQLLRGVLQLVTGVRGMRFKFEDEELDRVVLYLPPDDRTVERVHAWVQRQVNIVLSCQPR